MKKFLPSFALILGMLVSISINAQIRIDSSFSFGGNPAKKYSIYVPSNYNSSIANVMMVGFHPLDTSRWDAQSWCDTLLDFSEMNGILLICPDGGIDGKVTDSIDYAFTEDLIDSMKLWYNIDDRRIYTFGFSYGGRAVYEYGLTHASDFGGFMSLGVASSGWNINSLMMENASGRPFYLLHGNSDPNTSFVPLINALLSNCAFVDSMPLPGIGHSIDFPNRNQILSDAYKWIDSVNLDTISGTFSLVSPPNSGTIEFKGFHEYIHQFKWTESSVVDTCNTLRYEFMIDLVNQNFSNPLGIWPSDNGGIDTIFTVRNHDVDSFLANLGVPVNGFTDLKWTVRSVFNNHWSDTAKDFNLRLYRKRIGFDILSPNNDLIVTLSRESSTAFDWQDLLHYISIDYNLLLDDTLGNLTNPVLSYPSNNGGKNSNLGVSHQGLYFDLMFFDKVAIGDSVIMNWTATAEDTAYKEWAESNRRITFIRGDVGLRIRTPKDSSILTSRADIDYTFTWDSVSLPGISYLWYFDTLAVDLSDTAFIILNAGDKASIEIPFEKLDSLMNLYQVAYLDTLEAQWTVKAVYSGGEQYAMNTFKCIIVRAHPLGIESFNDQTKLQIYPNPASDQVVIAWNSEIQPESISISDVSGKLIAQHSVTSKGSSMLLDIGNYDPGNFVVTLFSGKKIFTTVLVVK